MNDLETLVGKIEAKEALIGIVGLGYVGLPLAHTFLSAGFSSLGFDIDVSKIESLRSGNSYLSTLPADSICPFLESGKFDITTDFTRMSEPDVIIICVPTPLTKSREPDMSFITSTSEEIKKHLRSGQIVVLESTTYPGTTDEVLLPILESTGLKVGTDFFLGFSPEREDPGNADYNTHTIPKVVSGLTPICKGLITTLYSKAITKVVPVSSTRAAELTKLVENIYRCVNIALVNELKVLCHRMGIDVHEVLDAASTKPFGFHKFTPGPGLGGHCIPIDPFYLTWKAREYDITTRFIELAGEVNTTMPYYVVMRLIEGLNKNKKSLHGASVLVIGLSYKKDIDDARESPSLKIIELLTSSGAVVSYYDPFFPEFPKTRNYSFDMKSVSLDESTISGVDCVLIATDHSDIDYSMVLEHAKMVIDSRNAMRGLPDPENKVLSA